MTTEEQLALATKIHNETAALSSAELMRVLRTIDSMRNESIFSVQITSKDRAQDGVGPRPARNAAGGQ